jgi:hypothetical protein
MRGTIAIVLADLAVACSERRAEEKTPESGGTLVIVVTQDPGTLFPPYIETAPAKQIAEQIYDYSLTSGPLTPATKILPS